MTSDRATADVASAVSVSTAAQLGSRAVHFVLNVIAGLALIRYFGPASYGDYVFVLTFATLFGLLGDFGLSKVAVRDMSRDARAAGAVLGTTIAARVALAIVAALLAQVALGLLGIRPELRPAIAVASLLFLVEALLGVMAVFQVRLAMQYEAIVTTVVQALDTIIILALIQLGAPLIAVVASPVVGGTAGVVLAYVLMYRRFHLPLAVDRARVRRLLVDAAPVGLTTMIVVLYVKTDAVILGLLGTPTDVGLFAAGYKPIEYALLALVLPINVLFPLLSRWYGQDMRLFRLVYWRGIDALLALTLPIVVLVIVAAVPIVTTLYAPDFAPSALPLRILALALPLMVLSAWQGFALLAAGRQRVTVAYDAGALALNVGLNFVLIPALGYIGAALAAVFTSVFVAACAWSAAAALLPVHDEPDRRAARVVVANLVLAATLVAGGAVAPLWAIAPIALLAYPLLLIATRAVRRSEIAMFLPAQRTPVAVIEQ